MIYKVLSQGDHRRIRDWIYHFGKGICGVPMLAKEKQRVSKEDLIKNIERW